MPEGRGSRRLLGPPDSSLAFRSRCFCVTAQLCPLQPRTDREQGDDGTWPSLTGNGGSQPLGSTEAPEDTERALWEKAQGPQMLSTGPRSLSLVPLLLPAKGQLPVGRDELPPTPSEGTLVRGKLSEAWCWGVTEQGGTSPQERLLDSSSSSGAVAEITPHPQRPFLLLEPSRTWAAPGAYCRWPHSPDRLPSSGR